MDEKIAKEIENLSNFIYESAKEQGSYDIFIPHEHLYPFLEEQTKERIKIKLSRLLAKKGIVASCSDSGYSFSISKEIYLILSPEFKGKKETLKETKEKTDTLTNFQTQFYAPKYFNDLIKAIESGEQPILVGPKGSGKSRTLEEAYRYFGLKTVRIPLGSVHDPATLIGTKEVVNDHGTPITKFQMGILTEGLTNGWGIILDEFDSVNSQVALALNMILENKAKVVCQTEHGTEIFERHPSARVSATANTWGWGEGGILYSGTEVGNRATWDRFGFAIQVDYDNDIEKAILLQWLPKEIVNALYDPANGIVVTVRNMIKGGEINDHLSFRMLERFAQNYKIFGWHKGFEYFIINMMNPAYREIIRQQIRLKMGNEFIPSVNDYNPREPNYIPTMHNILSSKGKDYFIVEK